MACGYFLYRMFEASNSRNKDTTNQFMAYIETKNGIVLKQAETFERTLKETTADIQARFDKSLLEQGQRHKEAMETFSVRMENLLSGKKKKHE